MVEKNCFLNFQKLLPAAVAIILFSCIQQNAVMEHFRSHDMTYPVDVSGVGVMSIEYVGIEKQELLESGAREFVESGITFIKGYFNGQNLQDVVSGAKALSLSSPVLYRDESDNVGLMVQITAYGSGRSGNKVKLPVKWLGEDKKLWRVVNFAYFSQN